jgi:hypothetical protein
MKIFMPFFALSFIVTSSVFAADFTARQKIFNVEVSIKPNQTLSNITNLSANIPVQLITSRDGEIAAIQVGKDEKEGVQIEIREGQKWLQPMQTIVINRDLATKARYKMIFNGPIYKDLEVFYIDATKLDPKNGGKITLQFPTSLVADDKKKVELLLRNQGGKWSAVVEEGVFFRKEKRVDSIRIVGSAAGTGIKDPEFVSLDPNQLVNRLENLSGTQAQMIEAHELETKALVGKLQKTLVDPKAKTSLELRTVSEAEAREMENVIPR